jgi:hypothetical protein
LLNYLKLYNHHIPQRAIGTQTPIQALKDWQHRKPELFVKRVYDQTGLDTKALPISAMVNIGSDCTPNVAFSAPIWCELMASVMLV